MNLHIQINKKASTEILRALGGCSFVNDVRLKKQK